MLYQLKKDSYPSEIGACSHGKCLIATTDLSLDVTVQKFDGPIVFWKDIPEGEICFVIRIDWDQWMIPLTDARYMNHSCNPNCVVNEDLQVITSRRVSKGEELTFSYNVVYCKEDIGRWDQRWNFKCNCGSLNCQKYVDKYLLRENKIFKK